MRVQHEHSAHSDKCIGVREFCRQSSPPPTLSSIEMADRSPRNVLRPTSIQSTIYKSTWVWRYKLNVGGEKGNIKAKNLAVGPGNASTSESNSTRWQSRSQELQPPRRFSYEHTRCMSSGVEFMDLTRTIGSRRTESCRRATPRRRAKQATGEFSAEGTIPIARTNSNVQYVASRVRRGVESSSFVRSTLLM
jgi:hypothetical protein